MKNLRRPDIFLFVMAASVPISFGVWQTLLNNFVIEHANFSGVEIGILQSLREIPGFLAFTVVFLLLVIREQRLALVSLLLLALGCALTGFFPTEIGLYCTTVLMSIGFHYYETVNQSLSLQWFTKEEAPYKMGRMMAVKSFAGLIAYGLVWLSLGVLQLEMKTIYILGGTFTGLVALFAWISFPLFPQKITQHKKLIIRKRYWLYYALTFMGGARRQIFVVFAGFLMVQKFGFSASDISLLFLVNGALNMYCAPKIGKLIGNIGERKTLTLEYIGLFLIFVGYAIVENAWFAMALYILDHLLFAMAIAQKTYFQKIADPRDMAPTAGVAFSINHIAAVILPAVYGILWLFSPAAVFLTGAGLALFSLALSRFVPACPCPGNEIAWKG